MKKVYLLPIVILALIGFISCEDESLSPLPIKVEAQYVILDVEQRSLDFNNLNSTAFIATLSVPSNNVSRYELFTRRRSAGGINTGDLVPLETITSFPHRLVITPEKLASALGLSLSDLQDGDTYRFIAFTYGADGTKVGYNDLSATLRNTDTMKQGYRWSTNLSSTLDPLVPFNIYTPF